MHNFSVVNKGEYKHKQTSDVLSVSRFLIVRKRAKRYLLLDLENLKSEAITGINFQIDQFDARGNSLGALKVSFNNLSIANGKFILKEKIVLHRACVDFFIKILCVEYGDYKYRLGSKETFAVYEKTEQKEKVTKKSVEKEVGKTGRVSSKRVFSTPVFVSLLAICVIAASIAVTFLHLNKFKEKETSFFLSNVEYEFVGGNNSEGSELQVKGYVGLGGGDLVIPAKIEGHPVTRITAGAFDGNTTIKSLKAEGFVNIEAGAFRRCVNLQTVDLGGGAEISDEAFKNCLNLTSVSLGAVNNVGKQAFYNCYKLENVEFKSSLTTVGDYAFYGCKKLKKLDLPDSVVYIGKNLLDNCQAIEEIKVPFFGSVLSSNLTLGYLFGQPDYTKQENQIPYTLKKVTLTKQKALPEGAFYGCERLTEINLPSELESIAKNSFAYCYRLKYLSIPSTVTAIEEGAFANNFKLFEIENNSASINIELGDSIATYAFAIYTPMDATRLEKTKVGDFTFAKVGEVQVLIDVPEMENLTLPTGVNGASYVIPRYFFFNYKANNVTLSSGVSHILDRAFYQTQITEIASSGGRYNLGEQVFSHNYNVKTLNFSKATFINLPENTFADNSALEGVFLPDSVTVIPAGLLKNCSLLSRLTLPTGITEIGASAFEGCSSLTDVGLKHLSSLTNICELAFSNCYSMSNVVFPSNVEYIGANAFKNTKVREITLPRRMQGIGFGIFENCNSLTKISVPFIGANLQEPSSLGYLFGATLVDENYLKVPATLTDVAVTVDTTVPDNAFYGCSGIVNIEYTKSVRSIGNYAFYGCSGITALNFTASATSVGQSAFESCTSLTTVELPLVTEISNRTFASSAIQTFTVPASVASIGQEAFSDCYYLTEVIFEENKSASEVELNVGGYVFNNCYFTSITLPKRATVIGSSVFKGCNQLTEITVPFIGSSLSDESYLGYLFDLYSSDEHYYIPYSLKKVTVTMDRVVADREFYGCYSLTDVSYRRKALIVGESAFESCSSLKSFDLSQLTEMERRAFAYSGIKKAEFSSSLINIPEEAFIGCENLSSVNLASVKTIGNSAFNSCVKLASLNLPETLTTASEYAFANCSNLELVSLPEALSSDVEILSGAFSSCNQLLEIHNAAKLPLIEGSYEYGELAHYAIYMPEYLNAPRLTKITSNGATYKYNDDVCALVKYTGNARELTLDSVVLNSRIISSYIITSYAFNEATSLQKVIIKGAVAKIREYAFTGASNINTVYFDGCEASLEYNLFNYVDVVVYDEYLKAINYSTFWGHSYVCFNGSESEYNAIVDKSGLELAPNYFYKECFHDYGTNYWNYDNNGSINFVAQSYQERVTRQPNCTQTGTKNYYCDICSYSLNEVIPSLGGHDYQGAQTTAPSCLDEGVMTYTCTRQGCGDSYTVPIPAIGSHSYTSRVTRQPTCTNKGVTTYTCSRQGCGDSYTEENLDALGHQFNSNHFCNRCNLVEEFSVTAGSNYEQVLSITSSGSSYDIFTSDNAQIKSTNYEKETTSTLVITARKNLTLTFKAKVSRRNYGTLTVEGGGETAEVSNTSAITVTVELTAGEAVEIMFTRNDVEYEENNYGYIYDIVVSQ